MTMQLVVVTDYSSRVTPMTDRDAARDAWIEACRTPGVVHAAIEEVGAMPWVTWPLHEWSKKLGVTTDQPIPRTK